MDIKSTNTSIDFTAQFAHMKTDRSEKERAQVRVGSPTICAIYARTLRLRSGIESVESQIETCSAFAGDQGLLVADGHIFCDQKNSNVTFSDRSGLKDLLDAARSESRQFGVVLIDKNSRFSRKYWEILGVYSVLSEAGVKVKVVPKRNSDSDQ
jgi:DNA invertase Pin-like site-specific DNA recombinase